MDRRQPGGVHRSIIGDVRLGIADHLGWAIAVMASGDHEVVDRRRIDFPDDIAVQRRAPYEARADAIMYRQELSELAHARDWEVHLYDAKAVVGQAASMLAERADEVLQGPRATIGPPWTKDHRIALAATVVGG
jgi:hypothetical protein